MPLEGGKREQTVRREGQVPGIQKALPVDSREQVGWAVEP